MMKHNASSIFDRPSPFGLYPPLSFLFVSNTPVCGLSPSLQRGVAHCSLAYSIACVFFCHFRVDAVHHGQTNVQNTTEHRRPSIDDMWCMVDSREQLVSNPNEPVPSTRLRRLPHVKVHLHHDCRPPPEERRSRSLYATESPYRRAIRLAFGMALDR